MLNVALWVVQGLLVGVFLLTGTTKLLLPREVLEKRMHWAAAWPRWRIKLLGLAEVAGAGGLVVPGAMGVLPVLSAIAALCLAVLMVGAVGTHRRLGESAVPAVVIGALCLLVGAARLQLDQRTLTLKAKDALRQQDTTADLVFKPPRRSPGSPRSPTCPPAAPDRHARGVCAQGSAAARAPGDAARAHRAEAVGDLHPGPGEGPAVPQTGDAVRGTIASGVIDMGDPRHVFEGPIA